MRGSPSKVELEGRIERLFTLLRKQDFDTALIIGRINLYYLTGTLQDGILVLQKDGTAAFFVRKSFERAKLESPLDILHPMTSYRDLTRLVDVNPGNTFMEINRVPLITMNRIEKYFKIEKLSSLDNIMGELRAVKSEFELALMTESGEQHRNLLENITPTLLYEGMSEVDLLSALYPEMLKLGYHGISRFSMFQMEMPVGQLGFGESSIYPTNFDGPGGMLGLCPAVPIIGSRTRLLKPGDLVFVDVGYGVLGYHTDKTQVYSFKKAPSAEVVNIHRACMEVQSKAAKLLRPGAVPSEIYKEIIHNLPESLSENFMGYSESVKFLGHGVGLEVDETPVIANGFNAPLKENMVIALEPKCGIKDVGTVGVEDTYLIKQNETLCLTGGGRDIITV